MQKIESFKINHLLLQKGLYVSRIDKSGDSIVTTFDLRFVAPYKEPVMDMPAIHTIEHLAATFLRNSPQKDKVIYFGPMGCRTGFYLVMFGQLLPQDVYSLVMDVCDFVLNFEGEIPGATKEQCGNYLEQNLQTAKFYTKNYMQELATCKRFEYPLGQQ